MKRYVYDGQVLYFNNIIQRCWYGVTVAESESKAKSNLAFQFKKLNGFAPRANITLPDKLEVVEV